jgi:hypothetical protein
MFAVPEVARILSVQGHVGYAWGFQERRMQTKTTTLSSGSFQGLICLPKSSGF